MDKKLEDDRILDKVDDDKRNFLKKVIIGTAFAAPVINSFSMEGLKIDLSGRMAKADDFDKPSGFDRAGPGGSGSSGKSGGSGKSGPPPVSPGPGPGVPTSS